MTAQTVERPEIDQVRAKAALFESLLLEQPGNGYVSDDVSPRWLEESPKAMTHWTASAWKRS
jgi:hypothetical protein